MKSLHAAIGTCALATLAFLGGIASPQAAQQPGPNRSALIPRAVGVHLTERGQRYFQSNLAELIFRQGYELASGSFPAWNYSAEKPLDLNLLEVGPEQKEKVRLTLGKIRDLFNAHTTGEDIQDPFIQVDATDIRYSTLIRSLSLNFDLEATRREMNGRGLILNLQAEIPSAGIQAKSIFGRDRNNDFLDPSHPIDSSAGGRKGKKVLGCAEQMRKAEAAAGASRNEDPGQFGGTDFKAWLSGDTPLKVTIPFSVVLNDAGEVDLHVLGFESNLSDLKLGLKHKPGLALPSVGISVEQGGRKKCYPMDPAWLEAQLDGLVPSMLESLTIYLEQYGKETLPSALNEAVAAKWPQLFSDVNTMNASGSDHPEKDPKYAWGIRPEEIRATDKHLAFVLSAWVDDLAAKDPTAEVSRRLTTQPPRLDHLDPSSYDAAMTVSEDLVNRLIGLGYQRGYKSLTEIPVKKGAPLHVLKAPEFRFDGSVGPDRGRLRLQVQHDASGALEKMVFGNKIRFEFDVLAKLAHHSDKFGNVFVDVLLDGVDVESLQFASSQAKFVFGGLVGGQIRGELEATHKELLAEPKKAVDSLPVPKQVAGVPLKFKQFRADPNGYLVVYFDYGASPIQSSRLAQDLTDGLALSAAGLGSAGTESSVPAYRSESAVPAIQVTNLKAHAGKYLHAFYLSSRPAAIGLPGNEPKVLAVLKALDRVRIPADGVVQLARAKVERMDFNVFNSMAFAVSEEGAPQLFLRNADRSLPRDRRAGPEELARLSNADFAAETVFYADADDLVGNLHGTITLDAERFLPSPASSAPQPR